MAEANAKAGEGSGGGGGGDVRKGPLEDHFMTIGQSQPKAKQGETYLDFVGCSSMRVGEEGKKDAMLGKYARNPMYQGIRIQPISSSTLQKALDLGFR
eukprot:CAMPEP_0113911186 /NCGR_PEP_ID=MMETSP0780_2-20120614/28027_1 /TAXON_ID=652834 /ORGANISM="Palpitomonas bilix" /LENGTH=97 /DNA_ID=CAMNT_0000907597 /DNA_START=206 /DNA_END=502 /DNA_ORIENTATION=- /assembly_acc=CAM_ASM_000599